MHVLGISHRSTKHILLVIYSTDIEIFFHYDLNAGMPDNRNLGLMSRRRFIEALTALGVSTAALQGLTKETFADLVDDPQKEIPVVDSYVHTNHEEVVRNGASPERKPVHRKIPRHQWVRGEAAHDAREQIDRQLAGVSEASASVAENSNGEDIIRVVVDDDGSLSQNRFREIERALPHTVDGVAGRGTDAEEVVRDIPVGVDRRRFDPSDAFPVTVNVAESTRIIPPV